MRLYSFLIRIGCGFALLLPSSAFSAAQPIMLDSSTHKFISPLTVDFAGVTVMNLPGTGGGTPGGTTGQIQYNNAGAFGGLSVVPMAQGGMPSAGGSGQVLSKNSATDYDTGWVTISSSSEGTWSYTAGNNAMADPSNGKFRTDQSTFLATANIAVSTRTYDNIDRTNILKSLKINDAIELQDKVNAANYARYTINGAPTNNTTWFQIPVSDVIAGGSAPAGNSQVLFTFTYAGGAVPPVNSVFGRLGSIVAVSPDYAAFYAPKVSSYTVATLPAGVLGTMALVTDGTAALAWGATVTGGGTTNYLVFYDGTAWTVVAK
jgi:hypothetical protein